METEIKIENRIRNKVKRQPECVYGYYFYLRNNEKKISIKTQEAYINQVVRFLDCVQKKVEYISSEDIIRYFDNLMLSKNIDEVTMSESYYNLVYAVINRFFQYLFDSGRIDCNPMENIENVK